MKLIVLTPFLNYMVGDEITDTDQIKMILSSDFERCAVKCAATAEQQKPTKGA